MKYYKPITVEALETLWKKPIPIVIPTSHRKQKLFIRVNKDGTLHTKKGGSYIPESKLKANDKIISNIEIILSELIGPSTKEYIVILFENGKAIPKSQTFHTNKGDALNDAGLRQLSLINKEFCFIKYKNLDFISGEFKVVE
jgi:hypothetical protein